MSNSGSSPSTHVIGSCFPLQTSNTDTVDSVNHNTHLSTHTICSRQVFPSVLLRYPSLLRDFRFLCGSGGDLILELRPAPLSPLSQNTKSPLNPFIHLHAEVIPKLLIDQRNVQKYVSAIGGGNSWWWPVKQRETNKWLILSCEQLILWDWPKKRRAALTFQYICIFGQNSPSEVGVAGLTEMRERSVRKGKVGWVHLAIGKKSRMHTAEKRKYRIHLVSWNGRLT